MNMLLRCAIIGVLASTPALAADHTAEVDAWHARRIESLQRPDGWLSLVGLHWITPGAHRLGSAADSGIVLNTGPAVLGQLERKRAGLTGAQNVVDGATKIGFELGPRLGR